MIKVSPYFYSLFGIKRHFYIYYFFVPHQNKICEIGNKTKKLTFCLTVNTTLDFKLNTFNYYWV